MRSCFDVFPYDRADSPLLHSAHLPAVSPITGPLDAPHRGSETTCSSPTGGNQRKRVGTSQLDLPELPMLTPISCRSCDLQAAFEIRCSIQLSYGRVR